MLTIRQVVVRGIKHMGVECDSGVLDELEKKILERHPDKPVSYAFITGRNWAIDQLRRKSAEERRIKVEAKKAKAERRQNALEAKCREEFLDILEKIGPKLRGSQLRHIRILWLRIFQGMSDSEMASLFLGTNRDLRHQWKRRGKKLILPHASKVLKRFLSKSSKQKRKE